MNTSKTLIVVIVNNKTHASKATCRGIRPNIGNDSKQKEIGI